MKAEVLHMSTQEQSRAEVVLYIDGQSNKRLQQSA